MIGAKATFIKVSLNVAKNAAKAATATTSFGFLMDCAVVFCFVVSIVLHPHLEKILLWSLFPRKSCLKTTPHTKKAQNPVRNSTLFAVQLKHYDMVEKDLSSKIFRQAFYTAMHKNPTTY
ncbi:MAG: hypothetical protein LBU26_00180 [Synergistaceae bacterium]|nr:hypothetical protein [Synergistaceae bacterium]